MKNKVVVSLVVLLIFVGYSQCFQSIALTNIKPLDENSPYVNIKPIQRSSIAGSENNRDVRTNNYAWQLAARKAAEDKAKQIALADKNLFKKNPFKSDSCPLYNMSYIATLYLTLQMTSGLPDAVVWGNWANFIPFLAEDAVWTTNVVNAPTVGIPAITALLYGIGTQYQNLTSLVSGPVNSFAPNYGQASFVKTQVDLLGGVPYNITFTHSFVFDENCKIKQCNEFADFAKTVVSLQTTFGDENAILCNRIKHVCKNSTHDFTPDFGTPGNSCFLLWKDAPYKKVNNTIYDDLTAIVASRTRLCGHVFLQQAEITPALAPFICPLLGKQIPGVPGCW